MELATLLGTYQSVLTNFGYLSKKWKENCEEERLLGVSLTGYYDNPIIRDDKVLSTLKTDSIETNKKYAKRFGINPSTAITCVKPHGNSGQLLGVGSGMHPWYSPYFIRRVRISHTDTLLQMARDQGVPCLPEVGQSAESATTFVLEFPVKAPEGAIFKDEVSALDFDERVEKTERALCGAQSVGDDLRGSGRMAGCGQFRLRKLGLDRRAFLPPAFRARLPAGSL